MSARNIYDITKSPPQYRAERFAIVGGLEDTSTDEFDRYIKNINEVLGALDDYQIDPEPCTIVGGFHGESIGKSASTVEADLREMFGYHKAIKPKFTRKVRPKKKKKAATAAKKTHATRKHKRKGGDDDSSDYNNDHSSDEEPLHHSAAPIDDFNNALAIESMDDIPIDGAGESSRNIFEDLL